MGLLNMSIGSRPETGQAPGTLVEDASRAVFRSLAPPA